MKFKFIYTLFVVILGATLFLGNSNGRADGANWGNTGAPGDETLSNGNPRTCQTCHGTGSIQVTMDLEVTDGGNPITAYIPGQTYDVTVRINHVAGPTPDGYGFQIVSLIDSNEEGLNTWSEPSSNAKIEFASMTGRTYVEHKGVGNVNVFNMKWTAPEAGSADVTFYSSGNGVDGNGATGNDGAAITSLTLSEDFGSSVQQLDDEVQIALYPNPTQDWLSVNVESETTLENTKLVIVNVAGSVVRQETISNSTNWQQMIDVSKLSTGVYFLQLQNTKGVLTKKFVKK